MQLPFTKMHGCGNDYIYINCFQHPIENPESLSIRLSDRHFGIGSDGLILICPSDTADVRMRMFNNDGSEGKMCGNGIRCVGKYAFEHHLVGHKETITVETLSGIKTLHLSVQDSHVQTVRVDMGKAELSPSKIPTTLGDGKPVVGTPFSIAGHTYAITCVSMGNPHCIIFMEQDVDTLDLSQIGPLFEHHPSFPERINTEFINVIGQNELKMRVWERGSGETLACGTGACASAVAACQNGLCDANLPITVHLRGGDLIIRYTQDTVWMTGSATTVFEGEIEV